MSTEALIVWPVQNGPLSCDQAYRLFAETDPNRPMDSTVGRWLRNIRANDAAYAALDDPDLAVFDRFRPYDPAANDPDFTPHDLAAAGAKVLEHLDANEPDALALLDVWIDTAGAFIRASGEYGMALRRRFLERRFRELMAHFRDCEVKLAAMGVQRISFSAFN